MTPSKKTNVVLAVATVIALAAVVAVTTAGFAFGNSTGTATSTSLPAYCVRPAGGYLIVVSNYGYNDSRLEDAGPTKPWPVVTVDEGQKVDIAVCNIDSVSHGFQVSTYVDSVVNIVKPGEELSFTFTADKAGTFGIYCAIPCDIHVFLQYGQLRVMAPATGSSAAA